MKNNKPKISVIVPVYNVERYLAQCLDSLVLQLYDNLEIICINDGSKDGSLDILYKYAAKDSRISFFSQENKGLSATRNRGVKEATGDWITFIDSDDWVSLSLYDKFVEDINKCEQIIDIYMFNGFHFGALQLENFNCVSQFWDMIYWKDFQRIPPIFNFEDSSSPFYGMFASYLKIYRAEWYKHNNFQFAEGLIFEDILFHVQSGLKAKNIYLNDDWLYCYREHNMSIMHTHSEKVFDIFKIMELIKREFIEHDIYEDKKYLFFNMQYTQFYEKFQICPQELRHDFLQKVKDALMSTLPDLNENVYNKAGDIFKYYSLINSSI